MEPFVYDFVHLAFYTIDASSTRVEGAPWRIQNTMYFLGVLTKELKHLMYKIYLPYHPYSTDVEDAVSILEDLRFISQNIRQGVVLTDDGKAVAEQKGRKYIDLVHKLRVAVRAYRVAGGMIGTNTAVVRLACRIHCMLDAEKDMVDETVRSRYIMPPVDDQRRLQDAVQFLTALAKVGG